MAGLEEVVVVVDLEVVVAAAVDVADSGEVAVAAAVVEDLVDVEEELAAEV